MAGAGLSFWLAGSNPIAGASLVVLCLLLNWFGDSLDGTVARVRDQQRPRYGYYVDHVLDLAGTAMLFAGLAASGYMTPSVAVLVVAAYYLVSAETFLATHSRGVFKMAFLGVGPTELRVLLAAGAIALDQHADGGAVRYRTHPALGSRRRDWLCGHDRRLHCRVVEQRQGALCRGDAMVTATLRGRFCGSRP